jgi:hypothetical protein
LPVAEDVRDRTVGTAAYLAAMTLGTPVSIAGESLDELVAGIQLLTLRKRPDGSSLVRGRMTAPVARACMRYEAKLLVEDAEAMESLEDLKRTPPQRRHDAFLELIRAITSARGSTRNGSHSA